MRWQVFLAFIVDWKVDLRSLEHLLFRKSNIVEIRVSNCLLRTDSLIRVKFEHSMQ